MKAAVIHDYGDMRIQDIEKPSAGPGELLVKTAVCGLCSGDLMDWYIRRKIGTVLGHEPAGTVAEVGAGVEGFQVGDRVFVHHHAPCGQCSLCLRGHPVQCETWPQTGIEPGGMAEYFRVLPHVVKQDVLALPSGVSFDGGALVEPLACSVKGLLRVAQDARRGTVVVIGLGVMGMLNLAAARHYGAGTLIGADLLPFRIERAAHFGADTTVHVGKTALDEAVRKATDGRMADLVIVGPANIQAMKTGLRCVGKGGTVLLFSPAGPDKKLSIDVDSLYFRDVSIVTSYSCGPTNTRAALALIEKGVVDIDRLVTHRFALKQVNEAYRLACRGTDSLKVLIDVT